MSVSVARMKLQQEKGQIVSPVDNVMPSALTLNNEQERAVNSCGLIFSLPCTLKKLLPRLGSLVMTAGATSY